MLSRVSWLYFFSFARSSLNFAFSALSLNEVCLASIAYFSAFFFTSFSFKNSASRRFLSRNVMSSGGGSCICKHSVFNTLEYSYMSCQFSLRSLEALGREHVFPVNLFVHMISSILLLMLAHRSLLSQVVGGFYSVTLPSQPFFYVPIITIWNCITWSVEHSVRLYILVSYTYGIHYPDSKFIHL